MKWLGKAFVKFGGWLIFIAETDSRKHKPKRDCLCRQAQISIKG